MHPVLCKNLNLNPPIFGTYFNYRNTYLHDNPRYADLINGVGCHGRQIVKETDLQEEDVTAQDKSRDILFKVAFGTGF